MKKFFKYTIIFVSTVILLFFALVVSSKIPHSAIEGNIKLSVKFYQKRQGLYRIKKKCVYSYIHYYADMRKLNIMYCLDSEKPIESTLWAKYYQTAKVDTNKDFIELVHEEKEPTTQYLRYWNGSMLFLRPLLIFFNMEQIYLINKILLSILCLILLIMLFKKSKKLAIIFLASLCLVSVWYASFYIEGSVMFYIMIIASIIAIRIDSNKRSKSQEEVDNKLLELFLITGIVTTFFDFLTTEILSVFVPLLIILLIRKENNVLGSFKDIIKFIIKACILWLIGYVGTWLAKWILSSLILHINAFEYVKDDLLLRVNGLQGVGNHKKLYIGAIERNVLAIPFMNYLNINFYKWQVKFIVAIVIAMPLIFINWKELKNKNFLLILVLIGIMPYIRYLILANHSYRHEVFTFRDQIITLMCLMYIIIDCLKFRTKNYIKSALLKK